MLADNCGTQDNFTLCVSLVVVTFCYEWEFEEPCGMIAPINTDGVIAADNSSITMKGFPKSTEGKHLKISANTPINERSSFKYKAGSYVVKGGNVTIPLVR